MAIIITFGYVLEGMKITDTIAMTQVEACVTLM
jgi:hypothetical protein